MDLSPKQQIIELLKSSNKILVITHENPDGDGLGSMLALTLALKKISKNVIPFYIGSIASNLVFLPGNELLTNHLGDSQELVISLDTKDVEIDKLGYKNYQEENKLKIVVKAKSGALLADKISIEKGTSDADLIITLDMSDLDRLGSFYEDNADLFYQTPVVNIDHHPGNQHFGKINWVDLTATSTAEMLVSLLESLAVVNPGMDGKAITLIDQEVATALLTGLITDTGSFQNANTTPKSLTVAAQLVALGARHQEIIKYVFKTKTLVKLKLWGRILSNLREEQAHNFIWAFASRSDFDECGADVGDITGVIDELLKAVNNVDFVLLLTERDGILAASLRSVRTNVSVEEIAKMFGGGGHKMAAAFRINEGTLASHGQIIVDRLRHWQQNRMNLIVKQPSPLADQKSADFPSFNLDRLFPPLDNNQTDQVDPLVIPNIARVDD